MSSGRNSRFQQRSYRNMTLLRCTNWPGTVGNTSVTTTRSKSTTWRCGSEDFDSRKVAAIAGGVACEQGKAPDGGVRANIEIRYRRSPLAPAPAIRQEAFPGQRSE